jgi:hypothetical protein
MVRACLYFPFLNFWTSQQIFTKFPAYIIPLKAIPTSCFLLSYNHYKCIEMTHDNKSSESMQLRQDNLSVECKIRTWRPCENLIFGLTAVTNEPLELRIWNRVWRETIKLLGHYVWSIACKLIITDIGKVRMLEIMSFKFDVYRIYS